MLLSFLLPWFFSSPSFASLLPLVRSLSNDKQKWAAEAKQKLNRVHWLFSRERRERVTPFTRHPPSFICFFTSKRRRCFVSLCEFTAGISIGYKRALPLPPSLTTKVCMRFVISCLLLFPPSSLVCLTHENIILTQRIPSVSSSTLKC